MAIIDVSLKSGQVISNWIRRRIWNLLFSNHQDRLGSFFLDPRDHIGSERIITGSFYESENLSVLSELVKRLDIASGSCVDVGANIGNHAVFFSKLFDNVICFEPGNIAYNVLNANIQASGALNCFTYKCALGSVSGLGSFVKVSDTNLGSSQVVIDEAADEIEIRVGDEIFASSSQIAMIKIDVEGAELDVLKGLRETIDRHNPLVCIEVLDAKNWVLVSDLLASLGYRHFYVLSNKGVVSKFHKLKYLFSGKRHELIPIPLQFPNSGYDMIFCMTENHQGRLLS